MTEEIEQENWCEPFIVKCIMDYSFCQNQIRQCGEQIYESNTNIKYYVDGIASIHKSILSQCYFYEPEFEDWICIVYIDKKGKLVELYEDIQSLSYIEIIKLYHEAFLQEKMKDSLSIIKIHDSYFFNIYTNLCLKTYIEEDFKNKDTCTYKLISIIYMTDKIEQDITIDTRYYINKNIILTPAFVLRELSYKNVSTEDFDPMNYKLEIMDHNLNVFSINCDQYILLGKNEYIIKFA
jgi:hypothetical protein